MKIQLKAYYNLLRTHPPAGAPPWQVEDYRELSTQEILQLLQALGISLDHDNFIIYAEPYENPEQLTDFLWDKKEGKDEIYLLLFELWRRFLPEKHSLSILGDELDYRILAQGQIENILIRVEEALNELVDSGLEHREAFQAFSGYCGQDFESFLYDYIVGMIDAEKLLDAAELIDSFYPFLSDVIWFDFLRARILIPTDPHEANIVLKSILDELKDDSDIDLLLEMAAFLVHHGDPHLFHQAIRQTYELLTTEEDFQELLAISSDYYQCLDLEKEAKELRSIFARRKKRPLDGSIDRSDPDLAAFESYLKDADWSKA